MNYKNATKTKLTKRVPGGTSDFSGKKSVGFTEICFKSPGRGLGRGPATFATDKMVTLDKGITGDSSVETGLQGDVELAGVVG
jgi:hypothetical protein